MKASRVKCELRQTFSLLAVASALALPSGAQQDPQATKILDAMSAKYAALKSFQASFSQMMENPAAKLKQNISGDMTVSGEKYHMVGGGREVISDGTTVWSYSKEENEVIIADVDPTNQEVSPSQMFTMYKKGYKYQWLKAVKEGGMSYDQIELTPENKANEVFKVQMMVSRADKSVGNLKTFKKNGTLTTFITKNFKPNVPITNTTFTFNKEAHPGVKVVDLRDAASNSPSPKRPPLDRPDLDKPPHIKLPPLADG